MKVFLVAFLLVAIAGVVFFFGWVQIQLEENQYAVLFTKTKGWDKEATPAGKFIWRWERLVPTNMSIHKYEIVPRFIKISSEGSLPSGEIYAVVLEPVPDFTFSLRLAVSYSLRPEYLPLVAAERNILPADIDQLYTEVEESFAFKATAHVRDLSTDANVSAKETADLFSGKLAAQFAVDFPELDIRSVRIEQLNLPDFELYQRAKQNFLAIAQKRQEGLSLAAYETAQAESRSERHFTMLEQYGKLLSAYPPLIELFKLKEGDMSSIVADLENSQIVGE